MRIATFNVQNLFSRPVVFNFEDHADGSKLLTDIAKLQAELEKPSYNANAILRLYRKLKPYLTINEDRGKLFKKRGWSVVGVAAKGRDDWDGAIALKRDEFSATTRGNTARVIRDVDADIMCVVEVEDRWTLHRFNQDRLRRSDPAKQYGCDISVEGNDPRGIDLGLLSRYDPGSIHTHVFEKMGKSHLFSRDCLELEVLLPSKKSLHILLNHFKSKYNETPASRKRRTAQANRVKQILAKKYDLGKQLVVVCGDFNDTPNSTALSGLLGVNKLHDVLELQFGSDMDRRWTYYFKKRQQIDYILVSEPLKRAFDKAGVERRGIYGLAAKSATGEKSYKKVTHFSNAASDHAAVWAEFNLS